MHNTLRNMCHCVHFRGAYTFWSNGPTYLKYMLDVDISTNGVLSALPMLCRYVGGIVHGQLADWLLSTGRLSRVNVRRVFNSICQLAPALALCLMAFSGKNLAYFIALQCVGFFFNGALASGHFGTPADLAPNFSGTLFGISNTMSGGATGFIVPTVIGALTQGNMTFTAWRIVFFLAAGIYTFGAVVYAVFISADIQPWNYPEEKENKDEVDGNDA